VTIATMPFTYPSDICLTHRITFAINRVHIWFMFQKQLQCRHMTFTCGQMQSCSTIVVCRIHSQTTLQNGLKPCQISLAGRQQQLSNLFLFLSSSCSCHIAHPLLELLKKNPYATKNALQMFCNSHFEAQIVFENLKATLQLSTEARILSLKIPKPTLQLPLWNLNSLSNSNNHSATPPLKPKFSLKFRNPLCNSPFETRILSQIPKPTLQLPLWNPNSLSNSNNHSATPLWNPNSLSNSETHSATLPLKPELSLKFQNPLCPPTLKPEFYLKFPKTLCNTHFEAQILSQNPKPTLQLPLWNPKNCLS